MIKYIAEQSDKNDKIMWITPLFAFVLKSSALSIVTHNLDTILSEESYRLGCKCKVEFMNQKPGGKKELRVGKPADRQEIYRHARGLDVRLITFLVIHWKYYLLAVLTKTYNIFNHLWPVCFLVSIMFLVQDQILTVLYKTKNSKRNLIFIHHILCL